MEILNASDAKREFGELLIKAQHEPVGINKNGKPVAVVLSAKEYAQLEACRAERLQTALMAGLQELKSGQVADGNTVIERLKQRVSKQ